MLFLKKDTQASPDCYSSRSLIEIWIMWDHDLTQFPHHLQGLSYLWKKVFCLSLLTCRSGKERYPLICYFVAKSTFASSVPPLHFFFFLLFLFYELCFMHLQNASASITEHNLNPFSSLENSFYAKYHAIPESSQFVVAAYQKPTVSMWRPVSVNSLPCKWEQEVREEFPAGKLMLWEACW